MAIATINGAHVFELYKTELDAAEREQLQWQQHAKTSSDDSLSDRSSAFSEGQEEKQTVLTDPASDSSAGASDDSLAQEIVALRSAIQVYQAKEDERKKRLTAAKVNEHAVSPLMQLWMVLLGAGIMVKETVKVAAAALDKFLFPLHFVIDGARSIWDLYLLYRNKTEPYRKTKIGAAAVNLAGLATAATVLALSITNPFALPVTFLGLTAAGLYKDAYALHQTRKAISAIKGEQANIRGQIEGLQMAERANGQNEIVTTCLARLTAKQKRLDQQLTDLRGQRQELKRSLFFHVLTVVAVGLLIAGAIAMLAFPPVAAAITTAGLLMFAATAISNVMSSPPVRSKMGKALNWFKKLWTGKDPVNQAQYQPVPSHDEGGRPEVTSTRSAANDHSTTVGHRSTPANLLGCRQQSDDNYPQFRAKANAAQASNDSPVVNNPLLATSSYRG